MDSRCTICNLRRHDLGGYERNVLTYSSRVGLLREVSLSRVIYEEVIDVSDTEGERRQTGHLQRGLISVFKKSGPAL